MTVCKTSIMSKGRPKTTFGGIAFEAKPVNLSVVCICPSSTIFWRECKSGLLEGELRILHRHLEMRFGSVVHHCGLPVLVQVLGMDSILSLLPVGPDGRQRRPTT